MNDFWTRPPSSGVPEELVERRAQMLEGDLAGRDIADDRVLAAMAAVPRHEFVAAPQRLYAYDDTPLRIGCGQTISQPYVVAFMTQRLDVQPGMRVLEVGTGSGYQTAILAELGAEVFTIERHEDLSLAAEAVIDRLGYGNRVTLRVDDGTQGWPEEAPFERIIVTAAAPAIPPPLIHQLAEGGLMIIPVGDNRGGQQLVLARKADGALECTDLLDVTFVPLMGKDGFR